MKKKIFSILLLLMAIVTGAKAANDVTLVSTNFTSWGTAPSENSGLNAKNTYTLTSGEEVVANVVGSGCKLNDSKNTPTATGITGYTEKWFRFGSSDNYLTITPTGKFYRGGKVRFLLSSNSVNCTNGTVHVGETKIGDITTAASADGGTTACHWVEFDIPSTVDDQTASIKFTRTSTTMFIWGVEILTNSQATEAYTVSFDAGTNGTCATTSLTEESAGAGVTLPAVTPNSGYDFDGWYDAASDGAKVGDAGDTYNPAEDITLYAYYSELTAPGTPSITGGGSVTKNASVTLTASATGVPAPTFQWYTNTTSTATVDEEHKIAEATSSTYSPSTATLGTTYYYVVATNSQGSATSAPVAVTVIGRSDCELINIKFSNGAWGAINSATYGDKTIAVPYTADTTAPTVVESSIVISDGATYTLDGSTLTVTAEDGTTNKAFTITTVAVTPLDVTADIAKTDFTAVPSWVFNLYGYDADKGLKFAKAVNDANMRIALGNTRQYYFIGAAKSLTLTAVEKVGNNSAIRKVNVYVNGEEVKSNTNNTALGAIELNEFGSNLVIIEAAAGTNGDGGFSAYAIEAATTSVSATIAASGYTSLASAYALDFANATDESSNKTLKAYYVSSISKTSVTLTSVDEAPANEGLILKGTASTAYTIPVIASASAITNELSAAVTATTVDAESVYVVSGGELKLFTGTEIPAGKAYLLKSKVPAEARGLVFSFDDEATGISSLENSRRQLLDGDFYNIAGQRVAQPVKGLYIVNGKKVVVK